MQYGIPSFTCLHKMECNVHDSILEDIMDIMFVLTD